MTGWIKSIINNMINGVLNLFTSATMSALNWVLKLLNDQIFHSPDLTRLPQVIYMSSRAQLAANACMTLIVVVVGLIAMTHGTLQDRHSLKELLPRMVFGFALANMANPIIRGVITAANAVTEALAGGDFTSQDSFNAIQRTVADVTSDPAQFIVALVLKEIAMWMLVLLVITWLGRLSVLLVVAATAPAALMCHAIPFAEPIAKLWWRALLSALAVQVLQAVTLQMAVSTMLVPSANLPALGLPHDPTGMFNMLVACFLLWMVIRIPKWVARNAGGSGGTGSGGRFGSIVRVVITQQVLGAVGLRGGGRKLLRRQAAAAGRGAGGPRQPVNHFHRHATTHQHLHMHPPGAGPSPAGGTSAGPGTGGGSARRPAYWAGNVTPPTRPPAGRPPLALPGRPAGSSQRAPGSGRT